MGYESAVKRTLRRVISRPQLMVHEVAESNRDKSWLLSRPWYTSRIEIWSEIEVDRVISRPWVSLEQRWVENWLLSRPQTLHIRTGRVHFKTFDDWIEARRANCNTLLNDVSSFISEKKEEDWQRSYPSHKQPNSWWKRNGDPQTSRSSHIDRGEISMGDNHSRRESTMEHRGKSHHGAKQSVPWATEATDGKQWPERERFKDKLSWQMPIQQTFHR